VNSESPSFTTSRGVLVIELSGSLDLSIIPSIKEQIAGRLAERPPCIVIDLRHVSYLDSSGIGLLIYIAKLANEFKGTVKYVVPGGFVFDVLHMVHFDSLFSTYQSRDKAVKSFAAE
jgi:anti-sigma B factor antagonist